MFRCSPQSVQLPLMRSVVKHWRESRNPTSSTDLLKEFLRIRADDHADHCCHYLRPLDGGRMASQTAVRRASLCSCCIASKLPKKLTQAKARHDFGANHLSCSPLRTGWLKCWNRPPKTKSSLKRRRPMGLCALDRQAQ